MRSIGQICLLTSLVCSGYAAFVYLAYSDQQHRRLRRIATWSGCIASIALCGVVAILAWGLLVRDFEFDYVARYSSRLLSWHYALSALWVGQAGSLLLWAWMLAGMAILFRFLPTADPVLRDSAFGMLMMYLCFLTGLMVFAADPCQASLVVRQEGLGLSPLLQHPSMLIHPPVVFVGYAAWTVPFAVAAAALIHNRLDVTWTQMARPWALLAWAILGLGLLLGAHWAYQELGWGGYWGWDPVENGSLLPWLTGAAFIHCLMAWRYRQCLKKSAVALAILTFGLCNFATFLTRSGVFSSVHAFSESPIGWMFLALMALLIGGGVALVILRRQSLAPERVAKNPLARETLILVSTMLFLVLTLIVLCATLVGPFSLYFHGKMILVEPSFFNFALIPIGVILVAITSAVPLLRWGEGPRPAQRRALGVCLIVGVVVTVIGFSLGMRHILSLTVAGLAAVSGASFLGAVFLDTRKRDVNFGYGSLLALYEGRRQYTGYVVHLGFVVLAIGITGSSLGSRRLEADMNEGESIAWGDRRIRYQKLEQRSEDDKLIAEAVLEVSSAGQAPVTLRPARHFHLLQNEWTTEVAIDSSWRGDFYTILNAGLGEGKVALTFVENPMMAWLWIGGLVVCLGALAAIVIGRRGSRASALDYDKPQHPESHALSDSLKNRAA